MVVKWLTIKLSIQNYVMLAATNVKIIVHKTTVST